MCSDFEVVVFLLPHDFYVFIAMIVVSDEMKQSMDNYSVEFFFELCLVEDGVFLDRIYTDEKITGKDIAFAIVESNDVSEIVVLKKLLIDIKNVVVGTENYIDLTEFLYFTFSYKFKPGIVKPALFELELCLLEEI